MVGTVGATHVRFLFGLPFGLLFLALALLATGKPFPRLNSEMLTWTFMAAIAQFCATALLLAAMRERSFVVTIALSKIEPVHVAVFGLVFLGDQLSFGLATAIIIATIGVVIMSWPRQLGATTLSWHSAALGIASGATFAFSAVSFRGAIVALGADNFIVAASTTLALSLIIQTVTLSAYLFIFERENLIAIFHAWRPASWARSHRRCGFWPSPWRLRPRFGPWDWSKSCSRSSSPGRCSSKALPPARRSALA